MTVNLASLRIDERHGVVAYPLLKGTSRSKLLIPDAEGSDAFRHRRALGAEVEVFARVPMEEGWLTPETIQEPVIYGGPLFHHFGHFIAESTHRLWPRWAYPSLATTKVAFHCPPVGDRYETNLPPWMQDIFDYLELPKDQIIMIDRPLLFSHLLVPDQGRWLGSASPDPSYASLLPRFKNPVPPGNTRLYVSRRRYLHAGSYLGEALVEEVLAKHGFRIIYPELEKPTDVIRAFCEAEIIGFCEGSAIHILELCGRLEAKVFVVCRRRTRSVETMFGPLLGELVRSYKIFGSNIQVTPLAWDRARQTPAWIYAPSKLDLAWLLTSIGEFSGVAIEVPSEREISRSVQLDLLSIILDKRTTGRDTTPESFFTLFQMLRNQAPQLGLISVNGGSEDDVPGSDWMDDGLALEGTSTEISKVIAGVPSDHQVTPGDGLEPRRADIERNRDEYGRVLWLFGDSFFRGAALGRFPDEFTAEEAEAEPLWRLRSPTSTINVILRDAGRFAGGGPRARTVCSAGQVGQPDRTAVWAKHIRDFVGSDAVRPGDAVAYLDAGLHACDPDRHERQWAELRAAAAERADIRLLMFNTCDNLAGISGTHVGAFRRETHMHDAHFLGSEMPLVRSHNDAVQAAALAPKDHVGRTTFVNLAADMRRWQDQMGKHRTSVYLKDNYHLNVWGQLKLSALLMSNAFPGLKTTGLGTAEAVVRHNWEYLAYHGNPKNWSEETAVQWLRTCFADALKPAAESASAPVHKPAAEPAPARGWKDSLALPRLFRPRRSPSGAAAPPGKPPSN